MKTESTTPEDPRTRFAGERTLLAWVRTSLAMMGFGFVVARFGFFLREIAAAGNLPNPPHSTFSLWIGTLLVLVGVTVSLIAAWEHSQFLWRLDRQLPYRAPRWSLGIMVALFLGILGGLCLQTPTETRLCGQPSEFIGRHGYCVS